MKKLTAWIGLVLFLAITPAAGQVNPVYRQNPTTGAATQQQPITVPSGMSITLQSGSTLDCESGSNCNTGTSPLTPSTLSMTGPGTVDVLANSPLNGLYATGGGSLVDICANAIGWACGNPGVPPKITSQLASVVTTAGGPDDAEQGIFLLYNSVTGQALNWQPSTLYTVGTADANVINAGNIYTLVTTGTSAGSGGPTGTGTGIVDGTAVWNYLMPYTATGHAPKQAIGLNTLAGPGSGNVWGMAVALQMLPGFKSIGALGSEWDMTNYSSNDPIEGSGYYYYNMVLGGPIGTHPLGAHLVVGNSPSPTPGVAKGAYKGVLIDGPDTIKDHAVHVRTNSQIGFYDTSAHTIASFYDQSTSPVGFVFNGTYGAGIAVSVNNNATICLNNTTGCLGNRSGVLATEARFRSDIGYNVNGVNGITCTAPTAGATITIVGGIITAMTGC